MAENFSNMAKDIDLQIQEAQQMPNRMTLRKTAPDTS